MHLVALGAGISPDEANVMLPTCKQKAAAWQPKRCSLATRMLQPGNPRYSGKCKQVPDSLASALNITPQADRMDSIFFQATKKSRCMQYLPTSCTNQWHQFVHESQHHSGKTLREMHQLEYGVTHRYTSRFVDDHIVASFCNYPLGPLHHIAPGIDSLHSGMKKK